MSCRPAPACGAVLLQASEKWPDRNRASDGICASPKHTQQNPTSDHEPDARGIAHAVDLTHDPAHGVDCRLIVDHLVERQDDRVKYLIFNRLIWRSYKTSPKHPPAWTPSPYTGPNAHTKHLHISVWTEHENDIAPWFEEDDLFTDDDRALIKTMGDRLVHVEEEVKVLRNAVKGENSTGGKSWLARQFDDIRSRLG